MGRERIMHCKKKKKNLIGALKFYVFFWGGDFLFEREEEVTIQESSKEGKESNEEVYWSGDGKKNH